QLSDRHAWARPQFPGLGGYTSQSSRSSAGRSSTLYVRWWRRFCSRCGFEAERLAEVVERGVDLAEGGFDGAGLAPGLAWRGGRGRRGRRGEADERPQQARAELDQEHAELEPARRQAVASAGAEPFDQAVRAELA